MSLTMFIVQDDSDCTPGINQFACFARATQSVPSRTMCSSLKGEQIRLKPLQTSETNLTRSDEQQEEVSDEVLSRPQHRVVRQTEPDVKVDVLGHPARLAEDMVPWIR